MRALDAVKKHIKQQTRKMLDHMPWAWKILRWYVRYFPGALVQPDILRRTNRFFADRDHRFVARTKSGHRIAGNTRDIVQRYLYLFGVWQPNLSGWISDRLTRGDVFVDVGSHVGFFSLLASRAVTEEGKVFALEPLPALYRQLAANVERNAAANIRLINCAASDKRGRLKIFRGPESNLGATSMYDDAGFRCDGEVDALPLSEVLSEEDMQRTKMIKIDVEGAEADVVTGLLSLLHCAREDLELIVEVGGGPKGSPSTSEALNRIVPALSDAGFNVYKVENSYDPRAYRAAEAPARPRRVFDLNALSAECDLVFSRSDEAVL
jgi:FkbM family methyltransferase